ncbi:hypothetical protein [Pedobacter polaris]|uniref:hypothetical protein n=1 Tax=Pedobacter polaris TaxID=2571273 RepID=UPI00197FAE9C|nr:hypothetical protein [Pedobacter polaris]
MISLLKNRKITYTLLVCLLSLKAFSQTNTFPASGNVGIGTTNPGQKLDVLGNISASAGSNEGPSLILDNSWKVAPDVAFRWALYNMTGHYGNSLQFWSYNQAGTVYGARLTLSDNGNVGVGTNPTEKLTVDGNVKLTNRGLGYQILNASLSETNGGASTILGNNVMAGSTSNTIKRISNPADAGSFVSLNYNHGITFHAGVTEGLNVDVPVEGSEKMRITQVGNVGIGTTTPNEKLSVNGKIRAHEIKVETANWPDYVFEDDYKIASLTELEKYIKQNKHLPEMPSAKEVEANGVELGEMVKLQQKKIEELTLHLINKDKELQTSDKRLQNVEARQKELEALLKKLIENK